jgi:uncharacterized protein YjbI with pentapeptide repeats
LKLLIPYKQRTKFGTHFILWLEKESTTISNLHDLSKILQDDKNLEKDKSLADKSLLDIYKKLIDIADNDLFTFLRVSIETLLRIDKIERYLRVLDLIGTTSKAEKFLEIDSEKQLDLLRNGQVTEFNKYVEQGVAIHLPFEKLAGCDLKNFRLEDSMLFRTDLSGANLIWANLSRADLSRADLSRATLSEARLSEARLSEARLSGANLSKAFLSGAFLSGADLSKANLIRANLSEANLSKANLSEANLSKANLSKANLSGAKLLNTVIINCEFSDAIMNTYTDFSSAIIDDPDFLKHLREKGYQNIPDQIKNKQELREKLLRRNLPQEAKDFILGVSQLPEH